MKQRKDDPLTPSVEVLKRFIYWMRTGLVVHPKGFRDLTHSIHEAIRNGQTTHEELGITPSELLFLENVSVVCNNLDDEGDICGEITRERYRDPAA